MTTKITLDNLNNDSYYAIVGPTFTSLVYPNAQSSTSTTGGGTITINGAGFVSGLSVTANNKISSVVSVISSSQLTFTAPANPAGTYLVYITNSNGSTAIAAPGLLYS